MANRVWENVDEPFVFFFAQCIWRVTVIQIAQHDLKGRVVVATENIPSGITVCSSRIRAMAPDRDRYSLQKDENTHVYVDEPGEIFSHSCEPNLAIRDNYYGAFDFFTVRPVQAGDELSFHYGMSEAISISVAACCCGSARCQGRSVGFWEMTREEQAALVQLGVSTFLQSWYNRSQRQLNGLGAHKHAVL
jgi:hypothetical protein